MDDRKTEEQNNVLMPEPEQPADGVTSGQADIKPQAQPMRYEPEQLADGVTPGQAEVEPQAQPMRYGAEQPVVAGDRVNPYSRFGGESVFVPPAPVSFRPGRTGRMKFVLWLSLAVMLTAAVAFTMLFINGGRKGEEESSKSNKVPYNGNAESSYAAEISLPDAPDVSADPNGPQISVTEPDKEVSRNSVNAAFNKASPSVVCVTSYHAGKDFTTDKIGDGSGIILTADGYVATNSHVVNDSMSTGVLVMLSDGTQYLGTVIGIDKKTDLAVIKIDAQGLKAAEFSDSDMLYVGQEVYAIGNPGGSAFTNSLTKGTVSAVNRILSSNGYVRYIQTDAAINPGNSGGALINEDGQVVGMNTSKLVGTDYEGMGFAIPGNKVTEIINKLIKYGYVNDRGTIGIKGKTCTLYESRKNNVPQGMVITEIYPDSPLSQTTVMVQDIITEVNGVQVKSSSECIEELSKYKPGDPVTLKLFRVPKTAGLKPISFEVTVELADDKDDP